MKIQHIQYLLFIAFILLAAALVVLPMRLQKIDIFLLSSIYAGRVKSFDGIIMLITNSVTPLSIVIPLGLLLWAVFSKKNMVWAYFRFFTLAIILTELFSYLLKLCFNRVRPYVMYPFIEKLTDVSTASFPSAHTSAAFAVAVSLILIFRKWPVTFLSLVWAFAIGYSRMVFGVHYPSDIVGGALLGSAISWMMYTQFSSKKGQTEND